MISVNISFFKTLLKYILFHSIVDNQFFKHGFHATLINIYFHFNKQKNHAT